MLRLAFFTLSLFRILVVLAAMAFIVVLAVSPRFDPDTGVPLRLKNLPDADYRSFAEDAWKRGDAASALAALEFVMENEMPDAPACSVIYRQYLGEVERRNSAYGRILAIGKGFVLGEVDGLDSLGGSIVADFLVYGDLRDIVKEFAAGSERDDFVLAMASLGLATTAMPTADVALSSIKVAKKTGVLAKPLQDTLVKSANELLKSVKSGRMSVSDAASRFAKAAEPIGDLAKNTKTWSEFSTIIKNVDNMEDLAKINAILAKSPANARILERAILLSQRGAGDVFNFVKKNGDKALMPLNESLKKGWRGVKILTSPAAVFAHGMKNYANFYNVLENWVTRGILSCGEKFIWCAFSAAAALALILIFPVRAVFASVRRFSPAGVGTLGVFTRSSFLYLTLFALSSGGFAFARYLRPSEAPENISVMGILPDTVWNVSARIEEDHFLNETYAVEMCAPLVKIGNGLYLPVSSKQLGLSWREIAKGGVYVLDVYAYKRGPGAASAIIKEAFILDEFPQICLLKLPETLKLEGHLIPTPPKASLNNFLLFDCSLGVSNVAPEIFVRQDGLYADSSKVSQGDSLVADSRYYAGMFFIDGTETAMRCVSLGDSKDDGEFQLVKIPLSKPDSDVYYSEFCGKVAELQKNGKL